MNGKVNGSWLTNGLAGSLDGDGFRQDPMTVLAGRLPRGKERSGAQALGR